MQYELIKDTVRITLDDVCGEGWNGDYDPNDPDDEPLLRFYVDVWDDEHNEYVPVSNGSYCTRLPANINTQDANSALVALMRELGDNAANGYSIKKSAERMSWISPNDLV